MMPLEACGGDVPPRVLSTSNACVVLTLSTDAAAINTGLDHSKHRQSLWKTLPIVNIANRSGLHR